MTFEQFDMILENWQDLEDELAVKGNKHIQALKLVKENIFPLYTVAKLSISINRTTYAQIVRRFSNPTPPTKRNRLINRSIAHSLIRYERERDRKI